MRTVPLVELLILFAASPLVFGEQSFNLTSPAGGESWMIGSTQNITWTSSDVTGTVCVEVLKRKKDGSTVCFAKADNIPVEDGKWQWEIPFEMPLTSFYVKISLSGPLEMEASGEDFSIVDNPDPFLKIRAPLGGETWARGTSHYVSWESHGINGELRLIVKKSGEQLASVSDIPASDGRYSWTVPADFEPGGDYTVTVRSPDAVIGSTSGQFSVSESPPAKKKWTFMKYIDCDNDLEDCELDVFNTISSVGSDADVNIVAQVDRHPAYDIRFGNWTDAKRFYVTKGMEPVPSAAVQDLGELNMADKATLADFLCWAMDNYPADRYFLGFSNHGLGWEIDEGEYDNWATSEARQGGGRDDTNGKLYLSNRAIQEAIDLAPADLAVVGFDACDMDMIEVLYQLRNTGAKVFLGSQNTEDYWGWDYVALLSALQARPGDITETEIGSLVCNTFMDNNERYTPFYNSTQAAIDLGKIESLSGDISILADAMRLSHNDKGKVKAAAEKVSQSVRQAVICERHSSSMDGKIFGMNIYFPDKSIDPKYNAETIDFATGTTWKSFLEAYFEQDLKSTWIGKARKGLWEEYEWEDPSTDFGHIDIIGFCQALKPEADSIRVNISASPADIAEAVPSGGMILKYGEKTTLEVKLKDVPDANGWHFVKWITYGKSILANPLSASTTLTAYGDGSATAIFAEDKDSYTVSFSSAQHGTLSGETTQTVQSGGNCSTVTAVPNKGYVFIGWVGDYRGNENPLTVANVISDMRITASFGAPVSMLPFAVSINVNNKKADDKISIKNSVYPFTADVALESAKVTIDSVIVFDCPPDSGWSSKNGVYTYSSSKGTSPSFRLVVDTKNRAWSLSASKLSVATQINPLDGVTTELEVNGKSAGKTIIPVENLSLKSSISYKMRK